MTHTKLISLTLGAALLLLSACSSSWGGGSPPPNDVNVVVPAGSTVN